LCSFIVKSVAPVRQLELEAAPQFIVSKGV